MMEVDKKSLDVASGTNSEIMGDISLVNSGVNCSCSSALEETSEKGTDRCTLLELEIKRKNGEIELLESKVGTLEVEKLAIEDELTCLKRRNSDQGGRIIRDENEKELAMEGDGCTRKNTDFAEDNDKEGKVLQPMIDKVLVCKKVKAEREVEFWKMKCTQLELQLSIMKEILIYGGLGCKSIGIMEVGNDLPPKDTEKTDELKGSKDGWDVGTNVSHSQREEIEEGSNQVLQQHTTTGGSTCCTPAKGAANFQASATPTIRAQGRKTDSQLEPKLECSGLIKKKLAFGEEGGPSKKMAPSTPASARAANIGVITISDSDDETDAVYLHKPFHDIQGTRKVHVPADSAIGDALGSYNDETSDSNLKRTLQELNGDEDSSACENGPLFISTPKRKRASNVIASDGESSDDNVPICKLKKKHLKRPETDSHINNNSANAAGSGVRLGGSASRRRLVTLRNLEVKDSPKRGSHSFLNASETKRHAGTPATENADDDESEGESKSEGESLGGFIVNSSDSSEGNVCRSDFSDGDTSGETDDDNVNFVEVISRIQRNRSHLRKWEFEADMLADLGKDPELCMEAVCAIYRQQTADEQSGKATIHRNQRGFSHCDAYRGTSLAEFLTNGEQGGNLKKSVDELDAYDSKGPEMCRTLANRYSKQLFAIYKNKEDPFFLPPS